MKERIIVVGATPPPHHGMTMFTENLLRSSLRDRFQVLHLDTSDHRTLDNLGLFDFLNVYYALRNLVQMVWLCIRARPALVYVPFAQNTASFIRDGLLVMIASWFSASKVVAHYHGSESFKDFRSSAPGFVRAFIKQVLRKIDVAIVVGENLRGVFDGDVRKVVSVHNGIAFSPDLSARSHSRGGFVTLSFLSNLVQNKGILDFLNAAARVVERHQNVCFKIAGVWWKQEPQTEQAAREMIAGQGLSGYVEFCGFVQGQQKERFLLQTDIFVFPTWNDSFGLVNLEAMAAGCPVISTRVGAIPEVVVDGVTGILVEKQSPQQLAAAMIKLIENPELRRRMGEAGRKRFEEHYTFEKCAQRLIAVFEMALA